MPTDLTHLKDLLARATPGEWHTVHGGTLAHENVRVGATSVCLLTDDDAELIVALHAAAPSLIAEIERLRETVRQLKSTMDEMEEYITF